ncbi:hypothetical protein SS50377_24279 [Spironucleus salmonicida]|uniref:Uncharacterized protein n=1 Tax=Spironucleus salmonicida TaxID=348837 RepID=V6LVI3_9EUKA|nr:hypothetical protein SS50377_24279 [Spironucleus salmonicida]|eukprot:EST44819.1 Hypothetical protein SS50377_15265 [Spironucleus salmonicida]
MFDFTFQPIKSKANKYNYRAYKQYISNLDLSQSDAFLEQNPSWTTQVMTKLAFIKIFQFIDKLQFLDNVQIIQISENQNQISHIINFDKPSSQDYEALQQIFSTLQLSCQDQLYNFIKSQLSNNNLTYYRSFQSLYYDFLHKTEISSAVKLLSQKLNLCQTSDLFKKNLLKKGNFEFQLLMMILAE